MLGVIRRHWKPKASRSLGAGGNRKDEELFSKTSMKEEEGEDAEDETRNDASGDKKEVGKEGIEDESCCHQQGPLGDGSPKDPEPPQQVEAGGTRVDPAKLARTEELLHDIRNESEQCKVRLAALKEDFNKMEEMVCNLLQFKSRIEQLKHEKSSLSLVYESKIKKYLSYISTLEKENFLLLNELKSLEASNCAHAAQRDQCLSRLLLARLRLLEQENSSLSLENQQQRLQYEHCLDDVASQVVNALMAQKSLREECSKLQRKVQELEQQNHALTTMFHSYFSGMPPPQFHDTGHNKNPDLSWLRFSDPSQDLKSAGSTLSFPSPSNIDRPQYCCNCSLHIPNQNIQVACSPDIINQNIAARFSTPLYSCHHRPELSPHRPTTLNLQHYPALERQASNQCSNVYEEVMELLPFTESNANCNVPSQLSTPVDTNTVIRREYSREDPPAHSFPSASSGLPPDPSKAIFWTNATLSESFHKSESHEPPSLHETSETGSKDEGYSTMSSDVIADSAIQTDPPGHEGTSAEKAADAISLQVGPPLGNVELPPQPKFVNKNVENIFSLLTPRGFKLADRKPLETKTTVDKATSTDPLDDLVVYSPLPPPQPTKWTQTPFPRLSRSLSDSILHPSQVPSSELPASPSLQLLSLASHLANHSLSKESEIIERNSPIKKFSACEANEKEGITNQIKLTEEEEDVDVLRQHGFVDDWLQKENYSSPNENGFAYDEEEIGNWSLNLTPEDFKMESWQQSSPPATSPPLPLQGSEEEVPPLDLHAEATEFNRDFYRLCTSSIRSLPPSEPPAMPFSTEENALHSKADSEISSTKSSPINGYTKRESAAKPPLPPRNDPITLTSVPGKLQQSLRKPQFSPTKNNKSSASLTSANSTSTKSCDKTPTSPVPESKTSDLPSPGSVNNKQLRNDQTRIPVISNAILDKNRKNLLKMAKSASVEEAPHKTALTNKAHSRKSSRSGHNRNRHHHHHLHHVPAKKSQMDANNIIINNNHLEEKIKRMEDDEAKGKADLEDLEKKLADQEGSLTIADKIHELNAFLSKSEDHSKSALYSKMAGRRNRKAAERDAADNKEGHGTSWIHVDFTTDPQQTSLLLDSVANAAESSSSSEDEILEHKHNQKLHALHRFRRHRKRASDRDAVISFIPRLRASIIDRKDFFYRFGEKEQEAVACFDFLNELSTSPSDSEKADQQHQQSADSSCCEPPEVVLEGGDHISFSDSCAESYTSSTNSLSHIM